LITLYGIPNCNTVKKARDYLAQQGITVDFHDFKKRGLDEATLQHWLQQRDWTELVNRKGLTWRGLTDQQKATDTESAAKLMLEKTSVIKRPLLEIDGNLSHVGYDEAAYAALFK
jgi:Spx/MgsR family transcriptional regulator